MFGTLISVALGGAIGASLRHLVGLSVAWPWGTLTVNIVGSFLIGIVSVVFAARGWQGALPFMMTGVLGGFTTFSAFSLDTLRLVEDGRVATAATYIVLSVMVCLLAAAIGLWAGRVMA